MTTGMSLRFQVYAGVNTTSRQGIKQLGNSFWFYFFFHFPMKVDGSTFIVAGVKSDQPPPVNDSPGHHETTYCRLEIACDEFYSRTTSL